MLVNHGKGRFDAVYFGADHTNFSNQRQIPERPGLDDGPAEPVIKTGPEGSFFVMYRLYRDPALP